MFTIKNAKTNYILARADSLNSAVYPPQPYQYCSHRSSLIHVWYHIPRRKTVELILVDESTGEVLKVKPKKSI